MHELFQDSGINVTTDVCRYLGSSLGSESIQEMLTREVQKWVDSTKELSKVAATQPHAAYAAFVHGVCNQWSYLMRTTPDLKEVLQPLEDTIVN